MENEFIQYINMNAIALVLEKTKNYTIYILSRKKCSICCKPLLAQAGGASGRKIEHIT